MTDKITPNLDREDAMQVFEPHLIAISDTFNMINVPALIIELGPENLTNPAIARTVQLARDLNDDVIAALAGIEIGGANNRGDWLRRVVTALAWLLAGVWGVVAG